LTKQPDDIIFKLSFSFLTQVYDKTNHP